jgi:hypothetical protein
MEWRGTNGHRRFPASFVRLDRYEGLIRHRWAGRRRGRHCSGPCTQDIEPPRSLACASLQGPGPEREKTHVGHPSNSCKPPWPRP